MPLSNREIENRAIPAVLAFERTKHRRARDVRTDRLSYDVKSTGQVIEVKGTRFASKASLLLTLLKDNFPKSLKSDDAAKVIEIMDRLSSRIPEHFLDDPSSVRRDIGFITLLELSRGSVEDKLGKLQRVSNEE